jgi:hypothetical protein
MALREVIARFGFEFDQAGLKRAQSGIAGVVGSLGTLGVALGAGVIVRGLANFVSDIVKAGDELGDTAAKLGVSAEALQRWRTAVDFAGGSADSLNQALFTVQKSAFEAAKGTGDAADTFKALGVSVKDQSGNLKDTETLLRESAHALAAVENGTERTALASKIFGKAAKELTPLLAEGEAGLQKYLEAIDEAGGGLSSELIANADEADKAFKRFDLALLSVKSTIAVAILPAISQMATWLGRGISEISKFAKSTGAIKSLLVALGLVLGKLAIAKFGASLLSLARAAVVPLLKFALLFLVIDDLIALFEGRGSVIGTFIDKIFGAGSAAAVVNGIKAIGAAISGLLQTGDFAAFDKALEDIFGPIGSDIVGDVVFTFSMIGEEIDAALDGIGQAWDEFWSGLGDSIVSSAIGITNDVIQLASGIVDGLVNGIKDGSTAVIDALGSVVTGAIDAAKKKLGIGSPSKVAARQVGGPFIEGIGVGALDAARNVARMTANAARIATSTSAPTSISAPVRGGTGAAMGGVVFKSDIALSVSGGSASDPQISKLRQGVRDELRDNRRATLDALHQVIEAPA